MPSKEYELATGNLLIGRFLWLVVRVPEGWAVKVGDSPSDVNYTTVVDGVGWVLDGSTSFFVVDLVSGTVVDLEITIRKGIKTKDLTEPSVRVINFNGHDVVVVNREVRRGLRREKMEQASLTIPCTRTSRTIGISLTAKNREALDELVEVLRDSRCH
ncbi:MAG: hypothetical protein RMI43_01465 [Candidatus Caldarchaeum sp.]|nr:hypothetical protein [Candidatus Caldarchaeum sp.]MCX8201176.1 hypothetical protein [Candidatus Caldarchaeum sp.]MDW8062823.1 hypothetical protein [Candidatus Caldarchaeum sp.]